MTKEEKKEVERIGTKEAAEILEVTSTSVKNYIDDGLLVDYEIKKYGRQIRYYYSKKEVIELKEILRKKFEEKLKEKKKKK